MSGRLEMPRPGLMEIAEIVASAVEDLVDDGHAETAEDIAELLLDDAIVSGVPAELVVAMVRYEAARRGVLRFPGVL